MLSLRNTFSTVLPLLPSGSVIVNTKHDSITKNIVFFFLSDFEFYDLVCPPEGTPLRTFIDHYACDNGKHL